MNPVLSVGAVQSEVASGHESQTWGAAPELNLEKLDRIEPGVVVMPARMLADYLRLRANERR